MCAILSGFIFVTILTVTVRTRSRGATLFLVLYNTRVAPPINPIYTLPFSDFGVSAFFEKFLNP